MHITALIWSFNNNFTIFFVVDPRPFIRFLIHSDTHSFIHPFPSFSIVVYYTGVLLEREWARGKEYCCTMAACIFIILSVGNRLYTRALCCKSQQSIVMFNNTNNFIVKWAAGFVVVHRFSTRWCAPPVGRVPDCLLYTSYIYGHSFNLYNWEQSLC